MANNLPTSRMFSQCFSEMEGVGNGILNSANTFKVCPVENTFDDTSLDMAAASTAGAGALTQANGVDFANEVTLTSVSFDVDPTTGVWSMTSSDSSLNFTGLTDTYVGLFVYNGTNNYAISVINFNAERTATAIEYTPDSTYGYASVSP